MNNYTDISFEDYIMADEIKDSTKNSNDDIVQKEMEDLENLDENKEKLNVSNRILDNNHKKLLCTSCYNKFLPICNSCGYRRKTYNCNKDNESICKICHEQGYKKCISCTSLTLS